MLNLERILQCNRLIRTMTELNRKAFEQLLPSFTQAYEQSQMKPGGKRKRAPSGGRARHLTDDE